MHIYYAHCPWKGTCVYKLSKKTMRGTKKLEERKKKKYLENALNLTRIFMKILLNFLGRIAM